MREIVFDTETTGFSFADGDRMVEIGCLEMVNRVETGRTFHAYFHPERAMPPEAGGQIPAVALTAFAGSEDRRQAMMAGFDIHIAKPAEPGELVAVVSRLATRRR